MKFFIFILVITISALFAHAIPTGTVDPLPSLVQREPKVHKQTPTPQPVPQICAQPDLAFGKNTCTYTYQFSGDSARSFILNPQCVVVVNDTAPNAVSSGSDPLAQWVFKKTCNYLQLDGIIRQNWLPTNQEYFMPVYQSDGEVSTGGQCGPSLNGHGDQRVDCTLKYNDLPDQGAQYAWICPFNCDC